MSKCVCACVCARARVCVRDSYGGVGAFEHVDDIVEVANGNQFGHLMVRKGGKLVRSHEVTQMMV